MDAVVESRRKERSPRVSTRSSLSVDDEWTDATRKKTKLSGTNGKRIGKRIRLIHRLLKMPTTHIHPRKNENRCIQKIYIPLCYCSYL